jgi:tripartite-type tricarboxylate transporter receptor subunit TctC
MTATSLRFRHPPTPDAPRRWLMKLATAGLALAALGNAGAQAPAGKPIRVIVPFAAGSYTDNVVRLVAPSLGEKLGATIVVDNRPGANGVIGADAVAKAAPDGTTFLMGGTSVNAANPSLYKSLPYDPVKDLVPVARFGVLPFLLVVNPTVPVKTVPELVDHARRNPGKLAYATPNSVTLVGMETFKRGAGVDILSVPYKSSPQAMLDLVGGQVQVVIADFATAMPHVRADKARVIAVTMARRSSLLPDVPAVAETIKGYDISAWNGLFAPAGTPRETLVRVHDALVQALASKELQDKLVAIGFDVAPMGPDQFGPYVREQIDTWGRLIRETGIKPE